MNNYHVISLVHNRLIIMKINTAMNIICIIEYITIVIFQLTTVIELPLILYECLQDNSFTVAKVNPDIYVAIKCHTAKIRAGYIEMHTN